MIRIKNNTKVKLIALFSAIALWMYVIAIVDPEDTKLIEDIPVTVSNLEELDNKELVIYPDESLMCSMNISGKLSNVKNIDKEDIKVYGEIDNPIEGKNEVYLRANMSERVSHEFTQNTIVVNLEKKISKDFKVNININNKNKENIESVKIDKEYVTAYGPRTQMSKVKDIVAKVDYIKEDGKKDINKRIIPRAVDANGKEVEGVNIEEKYINVNIKLKDSKKVPVKVAFENDEEPVTYKLNYDEVFIMGKEEVLKNIQYIETEAISSEQLKDKKSIEVNLIIPSDVKCIHEKVRVSLDR